MLFQLDQFDLPTELTASGMGIGTRDPRQSDILLLYKNVINFSSQKSLFFISVTFISNKEHGTLNGDMMAASINNILFGEHKEHYTHNRVFSFFKNYHRFIYTPFLI